MPSLIKKALLALLFTLLYLLAFATGSFTRPFHVTEVLAARGLAVRIFIWDGVLLMLVLYGLTLAVALAGKRLRALAAVTTGSLLVAAALGYALRLGFVTREF